jgi:hypothetical protein
LHPQAAAPDTTPLTFNNIPAGTSLLRLSERLRALNGTSLRCLRSSRDPSVQECRASFSQPGNGRLVEIWLSAIDSLSGILTLKYSGSSATLKQWRDDLERRYGTVPTQIQGTQRMKQWVRRGRMIRLTWRREGDDTSVSVSLVDGRVLDGWGQRKSVSGEP